MKPPKFQVGDWVKCIRPPEDFEESVEGTGWILGRVFQVQGIDFFGLGRKTGDHLYFPVSFPSEVTLGAGNNGVYEGQLRLYQESRFLRAVDALAQYLTE